MTGDYFKYIKENGIFGVKCSFIVFLASKKFLYKHTFPAVLCKWNKFRVTSLTVELWRIPNYDNFLPQITRKYCYLIQNNVNSQSIYSKKNDCISIFKL